MKAQRTLAMAMLAVLLGAVGTLAAGAAAASPGAAAGAAGRAAAVRAAVDDLTSASSVTPAVTLDTRSGTVEWLHGRFAGPAPGRPAESALRFLSAHARAFGLRAPREELAFMAAPRDRLTGGRDVYLSQSLGGVPVWNAMVAVHFDAAGTITGVSGNLAPAAPVVTTPRLSSQDAASRAGRELAILPPAGEPLTTLPRRLTADAAGSAAPVVTSAPRLVLYPDQAGRLHLSYEVEVRGAGPLDEWMILVDARTGDILARVPIVRTAAGNANGRGVDLFGKKVALNDYRASNGRFKLVNRTMYMRKHHTANHPYTSFEGCIEIRDAKNSVDAQGQGIPRADYPTVADKNKDNFFNHGGDDDKYNQRSAVSLARNFATIYKSFKARLARNSIDGKGISVIGNVHVGKDYENAYWQPEKKMMFFGDNKDTEAPFAKSLDIVAHEFGHGVTQFNTPGGLVYQYPSGAIDESMSDSYGCMVDYQDWLIGEDLGEAASRDLANPANGKTPLPSSMYDYNLLVLPVDGGGNHINCGVGGHFYQQLAAALPATPPAADGRFTAIKIIYRADAYLTPTASFRQWAIALRQAAIDLYGAGSQEATATQTVLQQLGMGYLDVEQNDNGNCVDQTGAPAWVMFGYGISADFLCVKFHTPAGAKLYRAYAALDPNSKPPVGAFEMYVTGVTPSGGPDAGNIIYGRDVDMNGILPIGNFTPIQVTAGGAPTAIDVPSDYFICIGYTDSTSPYHYGVLLTDDGTTPSDTSWWLHYDILSGQWQSQLFRAMAGNPVNFMLRPMYYYPAGPG